MLKLRCLTIGLILYGYSNGYLDAREVCVKDCSAGYTPCMDVCRDQFNKGKPLSEKKYERCKATCLKAVNACAEANQH